MDSDEAPNLISPFITVHHWFKLHSKPPGFQADSGPAFPSSGQAIAGLAVPSPMDNGQIRMGGCDPLDSIDGRFPIGITGDERDPALQPGGRPDGRDQ